MLVWLGLKGSFEGHLPIRVPFIRGLARVEGSRVMPRGGARGFERGHITYEIC